MQRRIAALVLTVALLVVAACSPQEDSVFQATNALRAARGVAPLAWNDGAYDKAVAWSNHMANQGRLSHSTLADGVPSGWNRLGENIAYAGTVDQAMAALTASPAHLANMVNPAFTSIAVGVVERDGRVWVTQVFIG